MAPLYGGEDAKSAPQRSVIHRYNESFELYPGIRVIYLDTGHTLGSASIAIDDADYVGMQSTYGNRIYIPVDTEENPDSTIVIVDYHAPQISRCRLVERCSRARFFGVEHDLYANGAVLNTFSAHADRDKLGLWAEQCGPQMRALYLAHGNSAAYRALARELEERNRKAVIPVPGDRVMLE